MNTRIVKCRQISVMHGSQLLMKLGLAEKDEIICRIGEMAQELFVLKAGEVQIFHPPSALAGRIAPLAVLKQPNAKGIAPSFGEECIQARDRYEFTVRAMCECVLYLIDKRDLVSILLQALRARVSSNL